MLVKDTMSKSPITIKDNADYKSAFTIMEEHNIHHLPIMNNGGEIVGLVALTDLQMAARCFKESPVEISEIMHTPVLTADANDTLINAVKLMIDNRFGCLPVVDAENKVVGMLTETDLFKVLLDKVEHAQ